MEHPGIVEGTLPLAECQRGSHLLADTELLNCITYLPCIFPSPFNGILRARGMAGRNHISFPDGEVIRKARSWP